MKRLAHRLPSHTTVVAYLCLFVTLGGGAYAAQKVGSGQLKKNAVTTSRIKNGAVTRQKLKNGAVNGAKVADGSITGSDLNVASLPVSRITHRMHGTSSVPLTSGSLAVIPLDNHTYTQAGDETDLFAGAVDVTFQPSCTPDRSAAAAVLVDSATPAAPQPQDVAAIGLANDGSTGVSTVRINMGPYGQASTARLERGSATNRHVDLVVEMDCNTGAGASASNGTVEVIGSR
jgi:hypothetical protein